MELINRKVFIVKGYSKSDRERSIDNQYCEWYSVFFRSTAGGSYYSNEIEYLDEPRHTELITKLSSAKLDFGVIVYIGHGANQDDNQLFQLNSQEIIKAGQYIINSDKQIIILESCRVLSQSIPTVDLKDRIPAFANGGIFRNKLTNEQSREIYDSHIRRCESGVTICYACKLGAEAYNYLFSKIFLQKAMDWHLDSSRHCAILPIDELMRLTWAETITTAKELLNVIQIPHDHNPMNFPIAVSKF